MATCEKHGCELTPLFTSAFCVRCDEEAAVNVGAIMKSVYAEGVSLPDCTPKTHAIGWYHNYPTIGTDANGSDVDDLDVCMGMASKDELDRHTAAAATLAAWSPTTSDPCGAGLVSGAAVMASGMREMPLGSDWRLRYVDGRNYAVATMRGEYVCHHEYPDDMTISCALRFVRKQAVVFGWVPSKKDEPDWFSKPDDVARNG